MVRLAPEICASRSEIAHPCRGSRASVVRISRSSVPCGRPVWGIGSIGPLVLRQEASASRVEVQHERDRIRRQRITRIVPDGWPRDSPFEIALATRSDRNHEWVREMMGPRRSKEQTHSILQQPWGYHHSRLPPRLLATNADPFTDPTALSVGSTLRQLKELDALQLGSNVSSAPISGFITFASGPQRSSALSTTEG